MDVDHEKKRIFPDGTFDGVEEYAYWRPVEQLADTLARYARDLRSAVDVGKSMDVARLLRLLALEVEQARTRHRTFFADPAVDHRRPAEGLPGYTISDPQPLLDADFSSPSVGMSNETFANQALQQIVGATRTASGIKEIDRLMDALKVAKEIGDTDLEARIRGHVASILDPVAPSGASAEPEGDGGDDGDGDAAEVES